jgi:transcriptional regulator with XRE-family HTH domain
VAGPKKHQHLCREIVQRFAEERQRKGLTVYALSKRTGLSPQAITFIEAGDRIPSLETALRIAEGLEIRLGDVINAATALVARRK